MSDNAVSPKTHDDGAFHAVERLAAMSQDEVDELPYGFVVLDEGGTILLYNRYESSLACMPVENVVGKNWFRDVAPCTRVDEFYGRFRALVAGPGQAAGRFRFRFAFLHGAQDVVVQMVKAPPVVSLPLASSEGKPSVFMTVMRKQVSDSTPPEAA